MTSFTTAALAVRAAYVAADPPLLVPSALAAALDALAAADPTDDVRPSARRTDPATSHAGAASARMRAGSQRHQLLKAFGRRREQGIRSAAACELGLTSDEAQHWSGVPERACYWKRVSELAQAELVAATGETRDGRSGDPQTVYAITELGRTVLAGLDR